MSRISKKGLALLEILFNQLEEECGYLPIATASRKGAGIKFIGPKQMRDKAFPLINIFYAYCGPNAKRKNFKEEK